MSQKKEFEDQLPERLARICAEWSKKCNLPIPEDSAALIRATMYSRKDKRGSGVTWRTLRKPRKNSTARQRCLHAMYQWHAGYRGASLYTPMSYTWIEDFDSIDTLALFMVRALLRRESQPVNAWNRALRGE